MAALIGYCLQQDAGADLKEDIRNSSVVMWIGAHPDDEIYVSGALSIASLLESKETYVVSLMRNPEFTEANKGSARILRLKEYITYDGAGLDRFFGLGPTARVLSERIKELILEKKPSLIILFEPTNGFRGHRHHIISSRIAPVAIKKSGIIANVYYAINRDEKLANLLNGPMDPLPYTDVINLDELHKEVNKSLREIKFELLRNYKNNLPEAKKLLEDEEKQKEVLHKEFYRKFVLGD